MSKVTFEGIVEDILKKRASRRADTGKVRTSTFLINGKAKYKIRTVEDGRTTKDILSRVINQTHVDQTPVQLKYAGSQYKDKDGNQRFYSVYKILIEEITGKTLEFENCIILGNKYGVVNLY